MKLVSWIPAAALVVTLAACGPGASATRATAETDDGTVTGTFMRVGGPLGPGGMQPRSVPLTGTVTFSASHHRMVAVQVGKTGRFSLRLPAGSYAVSGRSLSIVEQLASGANVVRACSQPDHVTVVARRAVRLSVVCAVP
jgi:hypothetical protein